MSKSVSVSKGKGSLRHNNRTIITDNVDPTRTHLNTYYKQEPLKEAYEKCFGAAIEEYNDKQKRADRKIDGVKGYMDKIRNSGNGEKLFYETIVQIGNQYDSHVSTADGELCKQMLDEYMQGFEARNPHLYVFNAVLHVDEQTAHLHIDYIPVADGYKQGMQVRNSLDKALKQQGINGKANKFENSTIAWENREKDHIETLMKERGIERTPDTGLKREHKSVQHYKDTVAEIENKVAAIEIEVQSRPNKLNKDEVIIKKDELDNLVERAKLSVVHQEAAEKVTENLNVKFEQQSQFIDEQNEILKDVVNEQIELKDELKKEKMSAWNLKQQYAREAAGLRADRAELQKETLKYTDLYTQQKDLNNINQQLKKENTALKAKIDDFERSLEDRVNIAVKKEKEPLQAEISRLQGKVDEQASQITSLDNLIGSLRDRLNKICSVLRYAVKAYNMLKYDKDGYQLNLPDKQSRLFDAIERYATGHLREQNREDLAQDIEKNIGFSEGISDKIKEMQPKRRGDLEH